MILLSALNKKAKKADMMTHAPVREVQSSGNLQPHLKIRTGELRN